MKMERSEWNLSHTMPAFVGGALQNQSDWRIPSFKGVLRHWWRIVACGEDPSLTKDDLLRQEGSLFGQVLDTDTSEKSKVILAFTGDKPAMINTDWPKNLGTVTSGKNTVDAALYLGYGAISTNKKPNHSPWINPGPHYQLLMQNDPQQHSQLMRTMSALNHFGGMGNRSRRSWGSICLTNEKKLEYALPDLLDSCSISLDTALTKDWVSGFVEDDTGPLIWESAPKEDWTNCVHELASNLKAANSTMRKYEGKGKNDTLATLGGTGPRWSSLLRLKVFKAGDGLRLRYIFLPCKVPREVRAVTLERHHCEHLISHLDKSATLTRLNAKDYA